MAEPPALLIWAGLILTAALTVLQILEYWRNRSRIEFTVLSATQYCDEWSEWEEQKEKEIYGTSEPFMKFIEAGIIKSAFGVLEFAIRNHYPTDVIVGRIMVDDWMFAGEYTRGMYDHKRDYRVFDLYGDKEPAHLDGYKTVPPGGSYGLRVEIFEKAFGMEARSFHDWHFVDWPMTYKVEIHTDVGEFNRKIKVKKRIFMSESSFKQFIYRWSDLIGPVEAGTGGAPLPQSLEYATHSMPRRVRLKNWYTLKVKTGLRDRVGRRTVER